MSPLFQKVQNALSDAKNRNDKTRESIIRTVIAALRGDQMRQEKKTNKKVEITDVDVIAKIDYYLGDIEDSIQTMMVYASPPEATRPLRKQQEALLDLRPWPKKKWTVEELRTLFPENSVVWYEIIESNTHGRAVALAIRHLRASNVQADFDQIAAYIVGIREQSVEFIGP